MATTDGSRLFQSANIAEWQRALDRYPEVIAAQGVSDLVELDAWYRQELPQLLRQRDPSAIEPEELSQVVRWKMKRGEWRARNLALVRANAPERVEQCSIAAFAPEVPRRKALATFAELGGVGPATASAVLAAIKPGEFPFLDDLVGSAIPEIGKPAFTAGYYFKYADALIAKASELGPSWTAQTVGLALWSAIGGKAALES